VQEQVKKITDAWVNPATVRGAILITAGVLLLAFPGGSVLLISVIAAISAILIGLTDAWAEFRSERTSWRGLVLSVVLVVGGVVMLLFTRETLGLVTKVLGVLVGVRGGMIVFTGVRSGHSNTSWLFDLTRGLLYMALAVIIILIPAALTSSIIIVAAIAVIVAGAIIISYGVSHPGETELKANELGGLTKRWLDDRDIGDEQRADLVDGLYFEQPDAGAKQIGFWTLLVLSVVIAALGVLADSTAVVIGAMLVAPLMTPIMGASAAIVNGWTSRMSRSFAIVVGGVVVAIGVAWIVAVWTPHLVPLASNTQVLSRTSPTMIDLMIAVAAGAAGAYATVDKRVSSSITGVAIAVALVPPLAVVGIMLQAGEWTDAWGAFLLFLTNFVSIVLVAGIVFLVTGLAPIRDIKANREKTKTVIATVALGGLIIIVPLAFTSEGILASATRQATTREVTESWLEDESGMHVARVAITSDEVTVLVSGEGNLPSIENLEVELEEELGTDVSVSVEYFPSSVFTSDNQ
jgi:uncharacterized hydrophobic protein (TIGR00271 family)